MNNQKDSNYKYVILIASIFLQFCLGATYSWSIFVEPLKLFLHKSQGQVQFPFSVFYTCFPCTMLFTGYAIDKFGIRPVGVFGVLLFALGWLSAGFFGLNIQIITLFIGVLGGIGVGFAYMVPIKACMQWFPRHKGLATGLAVAGFGGGAALLSQAGRYLMEIHAYHPLAVFKLFGFVFLIIGVLCALLIKSPSGEIEKQTSTITVKSILHDRMYWFLFMGMFAGLAGGFAIVGNLKQIYSQATPLMGATAVSFFAICNALGRVTWGAIHDKTGGKWVITANLISQAILLLLEACCLSSTLLYYLFAAWGGFNYGGVLVIYASEGGAIWGPNKFPKVYGWIFFANMPASLAPIFAGYLYDYQSSFFLVFVILAIYLVLTSIYFLLKYPIRKSYTL